MKSVVLRISNLPNRASGTRKRLPFATLTDDVITIESRLPDDESLNDHLVWLWGLMKHERRYIKSLQNEGAQVTIEAKGFRGRVEVRPNGAEMLHLLGVTLTVGIR